VCKHVPVGDEKHILDTPLNQVVMPKRMDAFVPYCMLVRSHRACLNPPTCVFEIVFRKMCVHEMLRIEDTLGTATQSRTGEGAGMEMIDGTEVTGHGTVSED
jgi:hypothetical protein